MPNRLVKAECYVRPLVICDDSLEAYRAHLAKTPTVGPYTIEPASHVHLDAGGMLRTDAKEYQREFYGAELSVYASHVEHLLMINEGNEVRSSGFMNFGSWLKMVVLSPERHAELIEWLRSLLPEAVAFMEAENAALNAIPAHPNVKIKPRKVRGEHKA
jgi:hypothetical protein